MEKIVKPEHFHRLLTALGILDDARRQILNLNLPEVIIQHSDPHFRSHASFFQHLIGTLVDKHIILKISEGLRDELQQNEYADEKFFEQHAIKIAKEKLEPKEGQIVSQASWFDDITSFVAEQKPNED